MEIALEAGADDVRRSGDKFEVTCAPDAYQAVSKALAKAGITARGQPRSAASPRTRSTSPTPTPPARSSSS